MKFWAAGNAGGCFEASSREEAALLFRRQHGALPTEVEEDGSHLETRVVAVCVLCGLPMFDGYEGEDNSTGIWKRTWRHDECPQLTIDPALIDTTKLLTAREVEIAELWDEWNRTERARLARELQEFAASLPVPPPATEEEAAFREAIARISEEPSEKNRALLDRARRAHVAKLSAKEGQ